MSGLLEHLGPEPKANDKSKMLERIVMLRGSLDGFTTYNDFEAEGKGVPSAVLDIAIEKVHPDSICNLQYTSGSTGQPKAAMLTHL